MTHEEDEKALRDFLEHAEEFKKDPKYQTMPLDQRDFFNEEIGTFKYALKVLVDSPLFLPSTRTFKYALKVLVEGKKRGLY